MEFKELYCVNCEKVIGRYNLKFYNETKIAEIINSTHSNHVKNGHNITIRIFEKN